MQLARIPQRPLGASLTKPSSLSLDSVDGHAACDRWHSQLDGNHTRKRLFVRTGNPGATEPPKQIAGIKPSSKDQTKPKMEHENYDSAYRWIDQMLYEYERRYLRDSSSGHVALERARIGNLIREFCPCPEQVFPREMRARSALAELIRHRPAVITSAAFAGALERARAVLEPDNSTPLESIYASDSTAPDKG